MGGDADQRVCVLCYISAQLSQQCKDKTGRKQNLCREQIWETRNSATSSAGGLLVLALDPLPDFHITAPNFGLIHCFSTSLVYKATLADPDSGADFQWIGLEI